MNEPLKSQRTYAPNITVRVSEPTKNKLRDAAKAHDRSIRQEIEARIQSSFEAEDLAATLMNDHSLMAPLVVFSREYGRILRLTKIGRGTKLAYGLAGEVFRNTMLGCVEDKAPSPNQVADEKEEQLESDSIIRKEAFDTLASLLESCKELPNLATRQLVQAALKECHVRLTTEELSISETCSVTFLALAIYKDAIDEATAVQRINSKMGWLNNATLQTSRTTQNDEMSNLIEKRADTRDYGRW